jgi:carbon monoxide dehydrogenase subunit G
MPVIEERFEVRAAPEAVWCFLLDPVRLGPCIPGATALEVLDEQTYRVAITVKVGFLSTTQDVRVRVVEAEPPRRLVSEGRGEDTRLGSRVELRSTLTLAPIADGATAVAYLSEVKALGRLGSIGDGVLRAKARELGAEFARRVREGVEGSA